VYLTQTTAYSSGAVVDTGWVAGFLLLGLAASAPTPPRAPAGERPVLSLWQVGLPYVLLSVAVVFILVKFSLDHHVDKFLAVDGLVLVFAVLIRQVVTLVEDARLNRALAHQAHHDPLTGLANRMEFARCVEELLRGRDPRAGRVAVLVADLDGFKDINDTLGHFVGDTILAAVAERLTAAVGDAGTVARTGGDEFAIVLGDVATPDQASDVALAIIDSFRRPFVVGAHTCSPWISIGIAMQQVEEVGVETFLRDADVALYAAKAAGGATYRFFNPAMGAAHFSQLRLQSDLHDALDRGELFVEFEPIVELTGSRPAGVEALLRWRHPTRGILAPDAFIEMAERSGSIVPIGQWALEEALTTFAAWPRDAAAGDLWLSVNISARQLGAGSVVASISRALENTGVAPQALRLELTERALIERVDVQIELLDSLKSLGVGLMIDDFGTGYSSLSYLKWLPIDALKIDRSFVSDIGTDPYATLLVEAMVRLGHARDIDVVAEGIETVAQLDRLRGLGCDLGQGFLWSQSLGSEDFGHWLGHLDASLLPAEGHTLHS
jgi:diguanylate cyclase (GGDEF)-like protein